MPSADTQFKTKHGHAGQGKLRSRTYNIWTSMRQRCIQKNCKSYQAYGARGIALCERWYDFANFLADMGEVPQGMTLDRIDNARGYELGNCRWATWTEQQRNRTNNRLLTVFGQTMPATAWAEKYGIKKSVFFNRLYRGWTVERALTWAGKPEKVSA